MRCCPQARHFQLGLCGAARDWPPGRTSQPTSGEGAGFQGQSDWGGGLSWQDRAFHVWGNIKGVWGRCVGQVLGQVTSHILLSRPSGRGAGEVSGRRSLQSLPGATCSPPPPRP